MLGLVSFAIAACTEGALPGSELGVRNDRRWLSERAGTPFSKRALGGLRFVKGRHAVGHHALVMVHDKPAAIDVVEYVSDPNFS